MNLKKYIAELKRRNVIKADIAYLVVSWLIAQVAYIFLPTFNGRSYVKLGGKDDSIRILQKAVEKRCFIYLLMQNESLFDFIGEDPEFQNVLQQAKVKHDWYKKKFF